MPAAEKLHAAIANHLSPLRSHPEADYIRVFLRHRHELPDGLRQRVAALARTYQNLIERLFVEGIASGELGRDLNPQLATLALLGLCNSVISNRVFAALLEHRRHHRRICADRSPAALLHEGRAAIGAATAKKVHRSSVAGDARSSPRMAGSNRPRSMTSQKPAGLPHAPAVPLARKVSTYTRFGTTFEPWEYSDWIDESMSWKETLYIGDWSPLGKSGSRGRRTKILFLHRGQQFREVRRRTGQAHHPVQQRRQDRGRRRAHAAGGGRLSVHQRSRRRLGRYCSARAGTTPKPHRSARQFILQLQGPQSLFAMEKATGESLRESVSCASAARKSATSRS